MIQQKQKTKNNNMDGVKVEYFTGTVVEIVDKLTYEIKVNIPGLGEGYVAYPIRGELDEPQEGDFVILRCLDPVYKSYFLWEKLKENKFIGIRSNGKMISITPDEIEIGTFKPDTNHCDTEGKGEPKPELENFIKIDKNGNITIKMKSDSNITIGGNATVDIAKQADIHVKGPTNITGDGMITVKGSITTKQKLVTPDKEGPFCALNTCLYTGAAIHCGSTKIE